MSNSKLLLSFFLFFFSFASSSFPSSNYTHRCSPIQTRALLLFKQDFFSANHSYDDRFYIDDYCDAWLGPKYYPIMMNWNTRIDCCNWDGVTCNHFTGDVIGLDLSCGMLQGTIHPNTTLFNLPHLQTLNLAYNHFSPSQLPHGIGKFSNGLTKLNISECGFTGQIPSDIFNLRYLEKLDLSYNYFTGQIPSDVSLLTKLVSLDLSWNRLDLQPHVFNNLLRNCTLLRDLSLADVNLSYVLPTYLNISSPLKSLDLRYTSLKGKLPDNIFNLQYLEKLDLSGNSDLQIQPPVLNNLLRNCTLLRDLSLGDVNTSYVLPTNYPNISSSLKSLDLRYTSLQGKLPDNIFNLQYLEKLDLSSNNDLTGRLPKVNTSTSLPLKWLDLSFTRLSGEIPDSIGHLKSLNVLQLSSCGLMGPLPKSLVNLTHLTTLDLSYNMFHGSLPSELFGLRSLKELSLGNNQFVGKITQQTFQQLVNLTYLDLSFNNFKGDWELDTLLSSLTTLVNLDLSYSGLSVITHNDANHYINPDFQSLSLASCKLTVFPESLRSLKNLLWLDLSNNAIHGHIPDWAGDQIGGNELVSLNISHNFITGLPQQFQWDRLEILDIQSNLIQGPFPPSICNLSSLWKLDMSNNSFSGVIPQCFGNTSFSLQMIDLHSNLIQGPFPPSICNLSNLYSLDMSNNSFSGVIPQCFGNTSFSLESIDLHSNLIQGPFPPSICNLSNLRYLDISNNSFSGVIPQCFGNISFSLRMIDMGNNHFHGKMPNVYENCSLLSGLILNGNQLEGEVPSFLSDCRSLEVLDLGNNHFDGTFPDWLGQLSELKVLVLKSNKLHGPIESSSMIPHPFPSLKILDLSQNKFVGHLPGYYFQNFDAMKDVVKNGTKPEYLSLGGRKFYTIIVTVKDLQLVFSKILVDYTIVDLSNNKFEGEIPNVINSLNSLKVFNLSHNKLSGRIPYALGNLSEIESFDLSWNQLTGEIPQSLVDLTTLEVLNLSQNHLVGRIPQGKQFNTFEGNSFEGNSGLCGFPLPKHCEHLSSPQLEADEDEESGFTWKAVMLGYGCGTLVGLAMGYLMLSTGRPKWFNAIADAGEQMMERRRNKRRYRYIGK